MQLKWRKPMSDKKLVHVELPEEVVEILDVIAELEYKSRSTLLREAIVTEVRQRERDEAVQEYAIASFREDRISRETLEQIVGPENAGTIAGTIQHLEERDEVIEEQAEYLKNLGDEKRDVEIKD